MKLKKPKFFRGCNVTDYLGSKKKFIKPMDTPPLPPQLPKKRGLINQRIVQVVSFTVLVICIIISVIACILAIWDFTKTDALWRTVATCIVVSAGMMAFGLTNIIFVPRDK